MDKLIERLPEIITAAAQSYLGILALLSVSLAVLAYVFFAKASEKVKVAIFVLLFLGVIGFGVAMFRVSAEASLSSPASADPVAALSNEATTLLKEAALDPSGLVLFERFGASVDLHTNDKSLFTDKADHRTLAAWEAALEELVNAGLLVARGDGGEIFEITRKGYEVAERID
jgi:ABC-type transport system involved in cytochrome bd biosynthesis fused ATPase/permease subunit